MIKSEKKKFILFLSIAIFVICYFSFNLSGCGGGGSGSGGDGAGVTAPRGVITLKGMLSVKKKSVVSLPERAIYTSFDAGTKVSLINLKTGAVIDETTTASDGGFCFSGDYRGKTLSIKPENKGAILIGSVAGDFPLNTVIMISFPFDGPDGGFDENAIIATNFIINKKIENKIKIDIKNGIPVLWDVISQVKNASNDYLKSNPGITLNSIVEASSNPLAPETRALVSKINLPVGNFDFFAIKTTSPQFAGNNIIVTITAKDAFGQTILDYNGNVILSMSDSGAAVTYSGSGLTDNCDGTAAVSNGFSNGSAIVHIKCASINEQKTLNVSDALTGITASGSLSWIRGELASFKVEILNDNFIAGEDIFLKITALSATGTIENFFSSTVAFSDSTSTITPSVSGNFINGVWNGNVKIMKAARGVKINVLAAEKTGASAEFNMSASSASKIKIITMPPPQAMAGEIFKPQPEVGIYDFYDNPVAAYDGVLAVTAQSASGGKISGVNRIIQANGVYVYTDLKYCTAENIKLNFQVNNLPVIESDYIEIIPGDFSGFLVTASSPQFAGTPIAVNIKAFDAYSNIITDYRFPGLLSLEGAVYDVSWSGAGVTDGAGNGAVFDGTGFLNGQAFVNVNYPAELNVARVRVTDSSASKGGAVEVSWLKNETDESELTLDSFEITLNSSIINAGVPAAVVITARNKKGGIASFYNSSVNMSDATGTISPAVSGNFVNGVWNGNVIITKARAQNTIMAVALGKLGMSGVFDVKAGAASKLVINRQPSSSSTAGTAFLIQPCVLLCDSYDNILTDDNSVVITAARGASGTAALQGTLNVTVANGKAAFTNLSYNKAEIMNISFTSALLSAVESSIVSVTAGPLAGFSVDSTSPQFAGSAIGLVIKAKDAWQNLITDYSGAGTLNLAGATGAVTWCGTGVNDGMDTGGTYSPATFADGAASISVSNSIADNNKSAVITDAASGKTGTAALSWINNIGLDHFAVSAISAPQTAGVNIAVTITAQDSSNATVAYNSTAALSDATGTISPGVTGNFVNGVWSGNVIITRARAGVMINALAAGKTGGSNLFTVNPAAASKLIIKRQPSPAVVSNAAFIIQPEIALYDAYDNLCSGDNTTIVTAARGSAGSAALAGTLNIQAASGAAAFTDLKYSKAEEMNINFTSGALTAVESNRIKVLPGALDNFILTSSGPAVAGSPITLYLKARDSQGNIITDYNSTGTLTIAGTTGGITWGGDGVADGVDPAGTFDGTGFNNGVARIRVTDSAADGNKTASITSSGRTANINLSWIPAGLDRFEISNIASPQTAGTSFIVTITAKDINGNTLTGFNAQANLSDNTNTVSPAVTGNFVSGVWSGAITLTKAQAGVIIAAQAAGKTGQSNSIAVSPAAAAKLALNAQPSSSAIAGTVFATQPQVVVTDSYGNIKTDDNATVITVARGSLGTSALAGTLTATVVSGVASFAGLKYNKSEIINLNFTSGALTPIESPVVIVSPGPLTAFSIDADTPQTANNSINLIVTAKDQYANPITAFNSAGTLNVNAVGTVVWSGSGVADGAAGAGTFDGTGFVNGVASISVNNDIAESGRTVTITSGAVNSTANVSWIASGLSHFVFNVIAGPQSVDSAFSVTITAKDINGNTLASFNEPAVLSDTSGSITPAVTGNFTGGVWSGNIQITKACVKNVISVSAAGMNGSSNLFDVTYGAANKLIVYREPVSVSKAGNIFAIQPRVTICDINGNIVTGDNTTVITVARGTFGSAALQGTLTATGLKWITKSRHFFDLV